MSLLNNHFPEQEGEGQRAQTTSRPVSHGASLSKSTVKMPLKLLTHRLQRTPVSHPWPESHSSGQKCFWRDHRCLNNYTGEPMRFPQVPIRDVEPRTSKSCWQNALGQHLGEQTPLTSRHHPVFTVLKKIQHRPETALQPTDAQLLVRGAYAAECQLCSCLVPRREFWGFLETLVSA